MLGDWVIAENLLPLKLRGVNVVLGMQRQYHLGERKVDSRALTMRTNRGDSKIILKASLTKSKISFNFKALMNWNSSDQGS